MTGENKGKGTEGYEKTKDINERDEMRRGLEVWREEKMRNETGDENRRDEPK